MIIENFIIESAKILKDKVSISYHTTTDIAKRTYDMPNRAPHPDFQRALDIFDDDFTGVFDFDDDITTEIKGISLNNKGQIQITGMIGTVTGAMCSLNTPYISKEAEDYNFDLDSMDKAIENVRIEAFNYIFNQKQAQQSIDFPEEETKETPKEEVKMEVVSTTLDVANMDNKACRAYIKEEIEKGGEKAKKHFYNWTKTATIVLRDLITDWEKENNNA